MARIKIVCKDCGTLLDDYEDERYDDPRVFEKQGPCYNCRKKY